MKKLLSFAAILALILTFVSCSQSSSAVNFDSLTESMIKADSSLPDMKMISTDTENVDTMFKYLSEMDYSKVEKFFLYYSSDGSPYEIAAIQLKSADDIEECENSLQAHIDSRIQLYSNYAPENVEKASKAQIIKQDNVLALIMCDNSDKVEQAFNNSFKQ